MELETFKIDAFSGELFSGNPAAVVFLEYWLEDSVLQKIAAENNLPETAFCLQTKDRIEIRWFTPTVEVDLCGHATLATAHVFFFHKNFQGKVLTFFSPRSGELNVKTWGSRLMLDFPADAVSAIQIKKEMYEWFSEKPLLAFKGKTDYMFIFASESEIMNLRPNLSLIEKATEVRGVIVTAKGDTVDFVSRFFAPQSGIAEDPVTGSAHTTLIPYWSGILNKKELSAEQLSQRRGLVKGQNLGSRVAIIGKCRTFLIGTIFLPHEVVSFARKR